MAPSPDLVRLDSALLDLRRFAQAPGPAGGDGTVTHADQQVEVSTVLVVDAVARRSPLGECSVGDVADVLRVTDSTASRLVGRAVGAGMVARQRSAVDPRRSALTLTGAGQDLQDHALAFRTSRLASLLADWSPADVATFTSLLERFAAATHRHMKEKP